MWRLLLGLWRRGVGKRGLRQGRRGAVEVVRELRVGILLGRKSVLDK
jgi:hypothetical protein